MFNPQEFIKRLGGRKAAVILLTFNRWPFTERCLKTLFKNTFFPHDLIVVDNGSWDETVDRLKHLRQQGKIQRLILLPENVGIAKGANYGFKAAASDRRVGWLSRMDNDILTSPGWLTLMCYVASQPGIGIVGANVQRFKVSPWKEVDGVKLDNCPNPGGLFCLSRATFKKLGYWQEATMYGLEDSELFTRQKHYGLRSCYVHNLECREVRPEIPFTMKHGESYRAWKTRMHSNAVKMAKQGKYPRVKHFETSVTMQDVEKHTWSAGNG